MPTTSVVNIEQYLISKKSRPSGGGEFLRLTKECSTLRYNQPDFTSQYLAHIKLLQEPIIDTNVMLTPDKQTILYSALSLPGDLEYLAKDLG